MSMTADKILILSPIDSFLTRSISARFVQEGDEVIFLRPDEGCLRKINESISACILYLNSEIAEDAAMLTFIKDRIVESGVPLFLLGKAEDISEATQYIPEDVCKDIFMRPVDVGKVVESVSKYIGFYGMLNRKVILCVDDSGVELRAVKNMFDSKYNVMLADSAIMAIKSMTLKRPDLILLDYSMPIVDGRQVYEMIKSENDFADIPIMFLTAMDDKETATKLMMLRPEAYILKGTPAQEIIEAVDNFFLKQRAR